MLQVTKEIKTFKRVNSTTGKEELHVWFQNEEVTLQYTLDIEAEVEMPYNTSYNGPSISDIDADKKIGEMFNVCSDFVIENKDLQPTHQDPIMDSDYNVSLGVAQTQDFWNKLAIAK